MMPDGKPSSELFTTEPLLEFRLVYEVGAPVLFQSLLLSAELLYVTFKPREPMTAVTIVQESIKEHSPRVQIEAVFTGME